MKIEAKKRLMAMQPINLADWKAQCKHHYPKADFLAERGSKDITAIESPGNPSDIVGVFSPENHVAWIMTGPGDFDEYDIRSSTTNPVSDGTAFETFTDGAPPQNDKPLVQKLTQDDGTVELPDEQPLLIDDLPYRRQAG